MREVRSREIRRSRGDDEIRDGIELDEGDLSVVAGECDERV